MAKLVALNAFLCLLLPCFAVAGDSALPLPAEVSINESAGRGGFLIVTLRLKSGEELPVAVDSGTSGTCFDTSLESKLGHPTGAATMQFWGKQQKVNIYAAPRLYLGGVPLMITGGNVTALDSNGTTPPGGQRIMGIIGMDVLEHYCIQLDFAAGKMRFLDDEHADKEKWGKAFPIVPLNDKDARPAVAGNLLGLPEPHSLIDSGFTSDGWLMPKYFEQWTDRTHPLKSGEVRSPIGNFRGEKYPFADLAEKNVESDGIGLRFLARHLVTLDFPKHTMYLLRQSIGPLPDPNLKTTRVAALDSLVNAVTRADVDAARSELAKIDQGNATAEEKALARNIEDTLEGIPKPSPAVAPSDVASLPLGDARAESAEVGWLTPTANRIPLNGQIQSPLLDSGKIYGTGLFAHSPSRYVYNLSGKWKSLRGEAGIHTAFQPYAFGVVFVIKTDGKEVFRSDVIRGSTKAHYDVNLADAKTLELIVEKAADQNGGNWALWLEPMLFRK